MGWEETINWITDAASGLGKSVADAATGPNWFQNLMGAASTSYDIYQGIQRQKSSDRMFDLMYGTAAAQDTWANTVKTRYTDIYWPFETTQYVYSTEDITASRPVDIAARDYSIGRKYQQITQAVYLNPLLDTTEKSLLDVLTDDATELRARLASDAVLSVTQSFDNTRLQDSRRLNVLGVNPSSGARLIYNRALAGAQALATATARNNAAIVAEDAAISRQSQALGYRAGVPLPQYQTTPSVSAGNITTALSSTGSIAGAAGVALDNSAQQAFTGAATSLNSMYMRPYMQKYMETVNKRLGV